jgi:alpha-tubulin suppressor-like RCC1 family protein
MTGRDFTLAIRGTISSNAVWGWGNGGNGAIGENSHIRTDVAVQVPTLTNALSISGGNRHSVAIQRSNGALRALGTNLNGEVGNNTSANQWRVQNVSVLTADVEEISAGGGHNIARRNDGTIWTCVQFI